MWLAAAAAFLLLVGACAPPNQLPARSITPLESPSASPSPTPTTAFAASGPGFHAGEVGVGYAAVALIATGGVEPYHWTVAGGALPPGLTLGADGSVSGTPASAGSFTFSIQAADSGDGKASIPGKISVAARLSASLLPACAQYCRVELGCSNACGAFGSFSGGIAPYTLTVKQGPLPVGTTLSPSALTLNGTFGGQPGYLQFAVQVGDAFGGVATVSPTFWMYQHVSLSGGTCASGQRFGTGCTVTLTYSGGSAGQRVTLAPTGWTPGSCSLSAFIPCAQPSFSVSYQPSQVIVTLTYGANYPNTHGTLAVRLSSTDLCGPGVSCTAGASITVNG
jgi:hypothetical protein